MARNVLGDRNIYLLPSPTLEIGTTSFVVEIVGSDQSETKREIDEWYNALEKDIEIRYGVPKAISTLN